MGDEGPNKIAEFVLSHACNEVCNFLGLGALPLIQDLKLPQPPERPDWVGMTPEPESAEDDAEAEAAKALVGL